MKKINYKYCQYKSDDLERWGVRNKTKSNSTMCPNLHVDLRKISYSSTVMNTEAEKDQVLKFKLYKQCLKKPNPLFW